MPLVRCKICNKEFYIKPSHLRYGEGKYCSRKCQYKGQRKGKFVHCCICGKKIWRKPRYLKRSKGGNFFCSRSCQTLWRKQYYSGDKHPRWKGGRYYLTFRNILLRKGITPICKICGKKDKRVIVVHHVDKNRNNNDFKNLVWLCFNCHYLVHNFNESIPGIKNKQK